MKIWIPILVVLASLICYAMAWVMAAFSKATPQQFDKARYYSNYHECDCEEIERQ